jgi:plastocyanin
MHWRSRRSATLAALAAALALAACGGSDTGDTGNAGGSPPAPPPPPPPATADGASVTAELAEFTISLSESTFEPGSYTFSVENVGGVDHALEIEGPAGEMETELIAPGESAELAVTLEDGSYELYCPVPGHREQGMELELAVGEGGVSTEPPATTGGDDDSRY